MVYSGGGLIGYGKLIIIKHDDTFLSAYAHNDNIVVKEQQDVKRGQKFEDIAKKQSKDPGSGANGGDLDFAKPDAYAGKQVEVSIVYAASPDSRTRATNSSSSPRSEWSRPRLFAAAATSS